MARLLTANLLMLLVLTMFSESSEQWLDWATWDRVWHLAALCVGGGLTYIVVLLMVGVRVRDFRH